MKKFYAAYGSNLNIEQMIYRCPTAVLHSTGVIENCQLQFKGMPKNSFATIETVDGAVTPVAVWEIQPDDEHSLDLYEGFPNHYSKQEVTVLRENGEQITAMAYVMNPKMEFGLPSRYYYATVHQGYVDCGLDTKYLKNALQLSEQKCGELQLCSQMKFHQDEMEWQ